MTNNRLCDCGSTLLGLIVEGEFLRPFCPDCGNSLDPELTAAVVHDLLQDRGVSRVHMGRMGAKDEGLN